MVANEIFLGAVPGKRFANLTFQPLRGRVVAHRKPQQPPPLVPQDEKCEQLLKRDRRDHKQINRCNPLRMIAHERLPGLQWPIRPRHYVDRNCRLGLQIRVQATGKRHFAEAVRRANVLKVPQ